jgi:hypothetical protein
LAWGGLTATPHFKEFYPKYIDPSDTLDNPQNINPEHLKIINIHNSEKDYATYDYPHPNGNT